RLEYVPHLPHALGGVLDVGLGVVDVGLEALAQILQELLPLVVGELCDVDFERVGPQVILVREIAAGASGLEVLLAASQRLLELKDALLLLAGICVEHLVDLALERVEIAGTGLVVNPRHHGGGEVQDLLELLGSHVEQVADTAGDALEEPDVRDRCRQVDMAHALTANLGARDLNTTALAHDPLVTDTLVFAAVALPVLGGAEDALAEEPVLLGLERAVVDRLGLGHLARTPRSDLLGGSKPDLDGVEIVYVNQLDSFVMAA